MERSSSSMRGYRGKVKGEVEKEGGR